MLPLLQAIYSKCATTGSIVAAFPAYTDTSTSATINYPVGVYHGAAPPRVPLPYMVITPIAGLVLWKYGGVQHEEPVIQFAVYAVGDVVALQKMKVVTDAFDDVILTLGTGHMLNSTRTSMPIPTFQDDIPGNRDDVGANVWQVVVTYEFSTTPT